MQRSCVFKVFAWICIGLAVSVCLPETMSAEDPPPAGEPDQEPADTVGTGLRKGTDSTDTTRVRTDMPQLNERIFPYGATSDSLSRTEILASRSVYREWWLWTVAVVVVATTIMLYAGGGDDEGDASLPDFPEPPEK